MRVSLLVVLALSALCAVSAHGVLDAGSDEGSDWVQPSFVEASLPDLGGKCGTSGQCLKNAAACIHPNTVAHNLCNGASVCCEHNHAATPAALPKPISPAPKPTTPTTPTTPNGKAATPAAAAGGNVAQEVATYIACLHSKIGLPYVFGGDSDKGYDCSGLTSTCAAKAGVTIPRESKDQINTKGAINVPVSQMQPGDLIFFGTGTPHHVASYIGKAANGDSQFIEAQQTGVPIKLSLNMEKRRKDVLGVRRIFH